MKKKHTVKPVLSSHPQGIARTLLKLFPPNRSQMLLKKMLFYAIIALNSKFIDKLAKKCIDSLLITLNRINKMVT